MHVVNVNNEFYYYFIKDIRYSLNLFVCLMFLDDSCLLYDDFISSRTKKKKKREQKPVFHQWMMK